MKLLGNGEPVPAYLHKVRDLLAGLPPPGSPFVLLVTGSSRAEHGIWHPVVVECLTEVNVWLGLHPMPTRAKVLRHGGAPGIDTIAHLAARRLGFHRDRMPSDWGYWGRRSGIIRNGQMVEKHPVPSACLAFFAESSSGTADCAGQARAAGIPTTSVTVEDLYLPHR